MAQYWGRFVPSVTNGEQAGEWEHYFNAEVPARTLKSRARTMIGKVCRPNQPRYTLSPDEAFPTADMSAMMLIWLAREMPGDDQAPDEVWHLTNHGGLIRTPWSVIIEPFDNEDGEESTIVEPTIEKHKADEVSVIEWDSHDVQDVWRPPTPEEVANRKIFLVGDKRPTSSGAFAERNVERFNPAGLRKPCEECGVVPSPFTLNCKC